MTAKEIASSLGVTERHARRLLAAHDPRIADLEKRGHSDISDADLERACQQLVDELQTAQTRKAKRS